MTVKEIFDLRKQGRIEEAYAAIRPLYAAHKGHYTTLCMFWVAHDIFRLRLDQGRVVEARKIFLALQRLLPNLDDRDGKAHAFMQYAAKRIYKNVPEAQPLNNTTLSVAQCGATDPTPTSLPEPHRGDTPPLDHSPKLSRLLAILDRPLSVREMMAAMGFGSRDKFLKNYLTPALKSGLIERTQPDSPKSPTQKYRKTQRN